MALSLNLITGRAALEALEAADNMRAWHALFENCPWATAFQHPSFVMTWYRFYGDVHEPVVVIGREDNGALAGLMLFCLDAEHGQLRAAGTHHAEYQAWLTPPEASTFANEGLSALRDRYPHYPIHLKYLPPGMPSEIVPPDAALHGLIDVQAHRRPLMRTREASDEDGNNRYRTAIRRLKQLRKLGALRFRYLEAASDIESALQTLAVHYDFRQGAAHGSTPFSDDPIKLPFHLALFCAGFPNTQACILELDERPIAGHFGLVSGKTLHNCLMVHSPALSSYSPGTVLLMMMANSLAGRGITRFDLTPGNDPWKERYADDHETTREIVVHSSRVRRHGTLALAQGRGMCKRALARAGVSVDRQRAIAATLSASPRLISLRPWARRLVDSVELRIYRMDSREGRPAPRVACMAAVDCFSSLLRFQPAERWQARNEFLSSALRRIEQGEHVYTIEQDGRLIHYGWLIESQAKAQFSEVHHEFEFPPGSAVLYDFYTHPDARGQGCFQASLAQMIHDATRTYKADHIFINVRADNGPSRHVIEKLGFMYHGSIFYDRILWRQRTWKTFELPARGMPAEAAHET